MEALRGKGVPVTCWVSYVPVGCSGISRTARMGRETVPVRNETRLSSHFKFLISTYWGFQDLIKASLTCNKLLILQVCCFTCHIRVYLWGHRHYRENALIHHIEGPPHAPSWFHPGVLPLHLHPSPQGNADLVSASTDQFAKLYLSGIVRAPLSVGLLPYSLVTLRSVHL